MNNKSNNIQITKHIIITIKYNQRGNNKNKPYKQERDSIKQKSYNNRSSTQRNNISINKINHIIYNKL
jgi:hypothetical protein